MNIFDNNEELMQLIANLYTLTGIRANIFDLNGKLICQNYDHAPFCTLIHNHEGGLARCIECDTREVAKCAKTKDVHFYRCHAGLCEAIIPICVNDVPMVYLAFGQFLSKSPVELQWQTARENLDWYRGDMEELRSKFFSLRSYSDKEVKAYTEILKALASYIHLSGMIQTAEFSDLQRLEIYLDQHFMEKITLSSISEDLKISRTKLCALAKQLSGGETLSSIIARRRSSGRCRDPGRRTRRCSCRRRKSCSGHYHFSVRQQDRRLVETV